MNNRGREKVRIVVYFVEKYYNIANNSPVILLANLAKN